MNREEKLEQLKQALKGVRLLMTENTKKCYAEKMLPIVQSATDFKVKMKNDIYDDWCEITFDLGDWKKEFGLDFTIRLNHDKLVEISHGWLSGATQEQRKYLIERDKMIGKLWDKQDEIKAVFDEIRQGKDELQDTMYALDREIWGIEDEIAKEERTHYLSMLEIGSKWVYKWEKLNSQQRPMTIEKITNKLVFYKKPYSSWGDNSTRMKITDIVEDLKNGRIIKYEEQPQASN